jgi:hypothetical protein
MASMTARLAMASPGFGGLAEEEADEDVGVPESAGLK